MIAELAKLLEDNNNNTDTLVEDSLMSNATLSNASPQMNVNELSFSEGDYVSVVTAFYMKCRGVHIIFG